MKINVENLDYEAIEKIVQKKVNKIIARIAREAVEKYAFYIGPYHKKKIIDRILKKEGFK